MGNAHINPDFVNRIKRQALAAADPNTNASDDRLSRRRGTYGVF
jgi:hypothetical protein